MDADAREIGAGIKQKRRDRLIELAFSGNGSVTNLLQLLFLPDLEFLKPHFD
jgi:hypothetical protein